MTVDEGLLSSIEKLRTPLNNANAPIDWKDWYHYILIDIQTEIRVLVNISLIGRIEKGETYAGKVLKTVHVGPYINLKATYDGLIAYIKDNGYEINGNSWEEYIDDPTKVPSEEVRTNIYFPVK